MLLSNSRIEIAQTAQGSKWWGSNGLLWNNNCYEIKFHDPFNFIIINAALQFGDSKSRMSDFWKCDDG